jgi:hypothetical protein
MLVRFDSRRHGECHRRPSKPRQFRKYIIKDNHFFTRVSFTILSLIEVHYFSILK